MPRDRTIPILFATLALVASASAGAGAWTTGGPNAPSNTSLAIASSDPSVLYLAAGNSGLFKTTNGGATWTALPNPAGGGSIGPVVAHPTSAAIVYTVVDGRLFRSADGGSTWAARQDGLVGGPSRVAVDPANPSTLYAYSGGAIFRSGDDGATWTQTGAVPPHNRFGGVIGFAFLARDPSTIFATVAPNEDAHSFLWKSRDAGSTWTSIAERGSGSIVGDPGAAATVYTVTDDGLSRSTDAGVTWTSVRTPTGVGASSTLAIDPADSDRLYLGSGSSGIFRSVDGGATWVSESSALPRARVSSIVIDPVHSATLYAVTGEGVFRSTDSGASWAFSGAGIAGSDVQVVATDPSHLVHAGTDHGLFRSEDGGRNWEPSGLEDLSVRAVLTDPHTPTNVFAVVDGLGVFRSADGGRTWSPANSGIGGFIWVSTIAIDPENPRTLYAFESSEGVVYKSTDGAQSWVGTPFTAGLTTIVIDAMSPSVVYAGAPYFDPASPGVFFKSTDGGASWTESHNGLQNGVFAIAIHPVNDSVLYVGTDSGVFKSSDGGLSWAAAGSALFGKQVASLAIDARDPNTIYAGTRQEGVYKTVDSGATWRPFNDGLANLAVTSLAIDPIASILHAGTVGGGVFEAALPAMAGLPCTPGPGTLCLLGNRFRVTVAAQDPTKGRTGTGHAVSQGDRFGYFSLPDFTGDPELPEVVVKMVDATVPPWNSFWFFYSGMTNLPHVVTVTDTATGAARLYSSGGYCGEADTHAFPAGGSGAGATAPSSDTTGALSASGSLLSLLSDRFHVTLVASDPRTNRTTEGTAIPQGDRFGYFSLPEFMGDPNFPEVFVKMIDASSLSGAIWLFHTGLTNLPYSLRVEDTATGTVRTYSNDHSGTTELCGGADTSTFRPYAPPITGLSGTWTGTERDRGLTDDYFCPSQPRTVSVQITQSGSHVSFSFPLGFCAGGGPAADYDGHLTASPNGIELGGQLHREAGQTSCALTGRAAGTAEASHIHLEGTLGGSCNQLGIVIDLTR